jgi:hypothetical protein
MSSDSEESTSPGTPGSPLKEVADTAEPEPLFPVEMDSQSRDSSPSDPDFEGALFADEINAINVYGMFTCR